MSCSDCGDHQYWPQRACSICVTGTQQHISKRMLGHCGACDGVAQTKLFAQTEDCMLPCIAVHAHQLRFVDCCLQADVLCEHLCFAAAFHGWLLVLKASKQWSSGSPCTVSGFRYAWHGIARPGFATDTLLDLHHARLSVSHAVRWPAAACHGEGCQIATSAQGRIHGRQVLWLDRLQGLKMVRNAYVRHVWSLIAHECCDSAAETAPLSLIRLEPQPGFV